MQRLRRPPLWFVRCRESEQRPQTCQQVLPIAGELEPAVVRVRPHDAPLRKLPRDELEETGKRRRDHVAHHVVTPGVDHLPNRACGPGIKVDRDEVLTVARERQPAQVRVAQLDRAGGVRAAFFVKVGIVVASRAIARSWVI